VPRGPVHVIELKDRLATLQPSPDQPALEATTVSRPNATLTDLTRRLPSGATVIAITDDSSDPRHSPVRELAARAAIRVGGTVLF
jgi:hypothetical protein